MSEEEKTPKLERVQINPWKYKIIYKWYGGVLRWFLGPAIKPLMSDLVVMLMETRARIESYHGKEVDLDKEISINQGINPPEEEK